MYFKCFWLFKMVNWPSSASLLQVKENTRAEKADLKLGDEVVSINGKDTSHMTLNEANRYLAKVSGGDVTLQVAK